MAQNPSFLYIASADRQNASSDPVYGPAKYNISPAFKGQGRIRLISFQTETAITDVELGINIAEFPAVYAKSQNSRAPHFIVSIVARDANDNVLYALNEGYPQYVDITGLDVGQITITLINPRTGAVLSTIANDWTAIFELEHY